jgi:hypothetical protein
MQFYNGITKYRWLDGEIRVTNAYFLIKHSTWQKTFVSNKCHGTPKNNKTILNISIAT